MSNTKQQEHCPYCRNGVLEYFRDMLKCDSCGTCFDIPETTQQIEEVKEGWKERFNEEFSCAIGSGDNPIKWIDKNVITPLQTSNQQLREQLKEKEDKYREDVFRCNDIISEKIFTINDLISTIQLINENIVTSNYKEANSIAIAALNNLKKMKI